jgi:hypothetical protein
MQTTLHRSYSLVCSRRPSRKNQSKAQSSELAQEKMTSPEEKSVSLAMASSTFLRGMFRFVNNVASALVYTPLAWIFRKLRSAFDRLFGPILASLVGLHCPPLKPLLMLSLAYDIRCGGDQRETGRATDRPGRSS